MEANIIIILISSTLFLAYLSGIFNRITRIPDILWLIAAGILFGPVLNLYDIELLRQMSPLLIIMALNILMFEAGLLVDLREFQNTMWTSTYLGLITFILTTLIVGYSVHLFLPDIFPLTQALLFGCMLGSTSTYTVNSIIRSIQIVVKDIGESKRILELEAIITDVVCILTALTLIRMIQQPSIEPVEGFKEILYMFFVSTVIGFFGGVLWVQFLNIFRNRPFNYIMTLASLFLFYIITERVGAAGPMTAIIYGLTLRNYPHVAAREGVKLRFERRKLHGFHDEMTFFIKSFLSVFIGMGLTLSFEFITYGIIIAIALGLIRNISVSFLMYAGEINKPESSVAKIIFSNGLTALVISQLPYLINETEIFFTSAHIYTDILIPVIFCTVLFGSLAGPYSIKEKEPEIIEDPIPPIVE